MPAPDIATLYQVEKYIEEGLAAVLSAETGLECFTTFSETELTTPRLEIECTLGEAITEWLATPTIDGEQQEIVALWNCTFAVRYITNPTTRGAAAAQHSQIRGKIRAAMGVWRGLFTTDAFPYHTLGRPLDAGTAVDVNNEEDFDTSEMSWTSTVNIRDDAWPAVSE